MVLAFGLQLPWQGFTFSDDWHFIYYSLIDGPRGLPELFHYDGHPQSTWGYILGFRLLGYEPLGWHLLSLFWKTASVLMFWGLLSLIWPEKRQQTFTAALIFALHPLFTLQIFAITYFEVWYSFFLLWLSIFLTVKAVQQPDKFWRWTGIALLIKVGHLFTSEYNWFLEVFRPLFVFLVLPVALSRAEKIRRTALVWLPYFILLFASVIWRGFFYQPLRQSFRVAEGVFSEPHMVALAALRHWIPDSGLTLFTSWFYTLRPEYLDFGSRLNTLVALVALAGGALAWWALRKLGNETLPGESGDNRWAANALAVGAIGMIAGFLPAYAAGYAAYLSDWPGNGRLALAAFPGAALILTALLELIVRPRARPALIVILAVLMVGWQARVNSEFLLAWDAQKEFYRQLTWRIPGLRPETTLFLANSYLPRFAPDSPAKMAVDSDLAVTLATNAMYSALPDETGRIPYWFSSNPKRFLAGDGPEKPETLDAAYATLRFRGNPEQIITLYFNSQAGECLRVLGPEYADYTRIPPPVKEAAKLSRPENILPDAKSDSHLRDVILGAGKTQSWCYYYQKGALAAQFGNWEEAIRLWDQSRREKVFPRSGYEFLPFIEARIHAGDWKEAVELTREARRLTPGMNAALCPLWRNARGSTESNRAATQANNFLKCWP